MIVLLRNTKVPVTPAIYFGRLYISGMNYIQKVKKNEINIISIILNDILLFHIGYYIYFYSNYDIRCLEI